jgi:hypothetical protein
MLFALPAHVLLYPAPTITAGVMRYVEITPHALNTVPWRTVSYRHLTSVIVSVVCL